MPRSAPRAAASFALVSIVLAVLALVPAPVALADAKPNLPWEGPAPRTKPGRIVVTFAGATPPAERRAVHRQAGARLVPHGRAFAIDVVELAPGVGVDAAIRRYAADPHVVAAEPDRVASLTDVPNDPFFDTQWALHNQRQPHPVTGSSVAAIGKRDADVDAPDAWDTAPTGEVVVAVLDTGVDLDHPDLDDALWTNAGEASGTPGVDDDGNGYVDDVHGWDFRADDANPSPRATLDDAHGTHVAGIVAAERDNDLGVAGICGACRIMALRFDLSLGEEVEAIEYAAANGADVINMSFSSAVWSNAERTAIEAAGDAGVLTVAAAGNASLDNDIPTFIDFSWSPSFPASYTLPSILSVAASNHRDQYAYATDCARRFAPWRCAFTSWGHDSVDVAAPGVDIMSTVTVGFGNRDQARLRSFDGTSMSSPLVAGIAGLVKDAHPAYTVADVKNAVMHSVERPSILRLVTFWADLFKLPRSPIDGRFTRTQGRVNAGLASIAPTTGATPLTDGNIDGAKAMTRRATGHVAWPADVNDVFAKELAGGHRYRIALNGPAGKDMDLWVWTPIATEIHQFSRGCFRRGGPCPALKAVSGGTTADEAVTIRVANTGTFYVQVQGWYSGGNYTLTVRRL